MSGRHHEYRDPLPRPDGVRQAEDLARAMKVSLGSVFNAYIGDIHEILEDGRVRFRFSFVLDDGTEAVVSTYPRVF